MAARALSLARALATRLAHAPWRREAAALTAAGALAACGSGGGDDPEGPSGPISPPTDVSGTWTGTATVGAESLPVRVLLSEAAGALSGSIQYGPPGGGAFANGGELRGSRTGPDAQWASASGGAVVGSFERDRFVGSLTLPAKEIAGAVTASLALRR